MMMQLPQEKEKKRVEEPQLTGGHIFSMCFYEFLGTAMLVLGYNFTAAGLAVGFNLFVGILMAGRVSGGMFNPAVTFAVYTANGKIFKQAYLVGLMILSQFIGGFFGVLYAHFCMGEPAFLCPFDQKSGCVNYDGFGKVFLLEFWCTFFFCQCIIQQINKTAQSSTDGILQAAAIAFTLLAMINTAGAISGGCFNPAFGLVETVYQVLYVSSQGQDGLVYFRYLWVYLIAPSLGGVASAMFNKYYHLENIKTHDKYNEDLDKFEKQ